MPEFLGWSTALVRTVTLLCGSVRCRIVDSKATSASKKLERSLRSWGLAAHAHLKAPQSASGSTETRCCPDRRSGRTFFANRGSKKPFRVLSQLISAAISKGCEQENVPRNGTSPRGGRRAWGYIDCGLESNPKNDPQIELRATVSLR